MWLWIIPPLDGQTIFSIAIGLVVSVVTFWIGYRQTIGAREERLRSANLGLASSVLRRIAVEREQMPVAHYEAIRRATAYRGSVAVRRLHEFSQSLDIATLDTLSSDFLDTSSKNAIIQLIDDSRATALEVPGSAESSPTNADFFSRVATSVLLAATSIATGAVVVAILTGAIPTLFKEAPSEPNSTATITIVFAVAATLLVGLFITTFVSWSDRRLKLPSNADRPSSDVLKSRAKRALDT